MILIETLNMARCTVNLVLAIFCIICQMVNNYDLKILTEAEDFLKEGFDATAVACQNFTKFACGKWYKSDGEKTEPLEAQGNRIAKRLEENLRKIDLTEKETPLFKKSARLFYDKCVNNDVANDPNLLIKNLYQIFTANLGLIPTLKLFNDNNDKSANPSFKIDTNTLWHKIGIIHLYLPDVKMFFEPFKWNLKRDNGCRRKEHETLWMGHATMNEINISVLFINNQYPKRSSLVDDEKIAKINDFQTALKTFANEIEIPGGVFNEKKKEKVIQCQMNMSAMDIKELANQIPNIPWSFYLTGLLKPDQLSKISDSNAKVFTTDRLGVYLKKFSDFISNFDTETVFNYMFYKALIDTATSLKPSYNTSDALKIICAKETSRMLPSASSRIVFDSYLYDANLWNNDLLLMFRKLKAAFNFFIYSSDWLASNDKEYLTNRVESIKFTSPIPAWFKNDSEVDDRTLPIDSNDGFLLILLKFSRFNFELFVDKVLLGKETETQQASLHITAEYIDLEVSVGLGMVLPPWYHPEYPLSVKYGILGYMIGHEIMHGFEIESSNGWPTELNFYLQPETVRWFQVKMKCLEKQYSAFCFDIHRICLNGFVTRNENKADVDGLIIAYMAYKYAAQASIKESTLSGVLYRLNSEQIFFLANARLKCTMGSEVLPLLSANNVYAPWLPRSDLPMKNFPVFGSVYDCDTGTAYAPKSTCSILGSFIDGAKLKKL